MNPRPRLFSWSIFCLSTFPYFFSGCSVSKQTADLIVHNGKVVTVDTGDTVAQAMAIRGERILSVGSNEEILKLKGSATEVIDLQGKAVLP